MEKHKPKLLYFANYYKPDKSAMARLMTDLSEGLADDFDVTVVTSVPSYAGKIEEKYKGKRFYYEETDKLHVIRVKVSENDKSSKLKRIRHITDYFFNAIRVVRKLGKFDLVYATTAPPVLGGFLGRIGKRITKGKFLYAIQDFNPEQIEAVSYSKNKLVISTLRKIDHKTCKKADALVIIGRDMQETLDRRFPDGSVKGHYIHNWVDEEGMYPLDKNDPQVIAFKEKYGLQGKYVLMYLGNLGLYYDLLELVKIAGKFQNEKDTVFVFVGTGAVENQMKDYVKENNLSNILFIPYVTGNDLLCAMNAADVHIVTNSKGIKGVSVPSKIYGIMAVNKPVMGILEPGSEVWNVIKESDIGIVCETGNYAEIEEGIRFVLDNRQQLNEKGKTSRDVLLTRYSKSNSITGYKEAFHRLLEGGSS